MPPSTPPTHIWRQIPTPAPDAVVTGPDLKTATPTFPLGTVVVNNSTTWNQVTTYLKTLTNKHVELGGHGTPGQFYWNVVLVLDGPKVATNNWLNGRQNLSNSRRYQL